MNQPPPTSRFPVGEIVSTPGALTLLRAHNISPFHFVALHQSGRWGVVSLADARINELALLTSAQLVSVYLVEGEHLWVITEADRSTTTLLLPEEY
jgi:hypothetical protein